MIKLEFYKNDYYECVELIGVYTQPKAMREHLIEHMDYRYLESWIQDEIIEQFDELDFTDVEELFKDGMIRLHTQDYNVYLEPLILNQKYSN